MTNANPAPDADETTTVEGVAEYLADVTMTPVVRFVEVADAVHVNPDNVTHVSEADGAAIVHFIGGRSVAIAECSAAVIVDILAAE